MFEFELRSSCLYSKFFYSPRHLLSNENSLLFSSVSGNRKQNQRVYLVNFTVSKSDSEMLALK